MDNITLVILVLGLIVAYNSYRVRNKVKKSGLPLPNQSSWHHLLYSGDDETFLCITGFTKSAFLELVGICFTNDEINPPPSRGRKPTLNCFARLGLLLLYLGSRVQTKFLCMIFGATPSIIERDIKFMIRLVIEKLINHPASRIRFPTQEEMAQFAAIISHREPLAENVIAFLDGLSLPTQCNSSIADQTAKYNGYYHDTAVNNVLLFSPLGKSRN